MSTDATPTTPTLCPRRLELLRQAERGCFLFADGADLAWVGYHPTVADPDRLYEAAGVWRDDDAEHLLREARRHLKECGVDVRQAPLRKLLAKAVTAGSARNMTALRQSVANLIRAGCQLNAWHAGARSR